MNTGLEPVERTVSWRKAWKQGVLGLVDRIYWLFNQPITIEIVVIGPENSGKTSIVRRFAGDIFYEEKVESPDCPFKTVNVLKVRNKVRRFNVKVVEASRRKTSEYYDLLSSASGLIMVYSTDNPEQFHEVDEFLKRLYSKRSKKRSCSTVVVVGNKTEITTSMDQVEKNTEVKDAVQSAGISYFSVSAKSNWGIYDAFDELILQCALKKVRGFTLHKSRRTKKSLHRNHLHDEESTPFSQV